MKRVAVSSSLLLSALLFAAPQVIYACQCFAIPPIYESFRQADAVFVGKVVASNEPARSDQTPFYDDVIFDFEVVEAFKGVSGKSVKLNRGSTASSCYSGYRVGTTYLIYADKRGHSFVAQNSDPAANVVFQSNFCNRSTSFDYARDQLIFIRRFLQRKREPQIYGSVGRSSIDASTGRYGYEYLSGVSVLLDTNGKEYRTKTDTNGVFLFNNIPAGEYKLRPEPADGTSIVHEEIITIVDDKSAIDPDPYSAIYPNHFQRFSLGWNNRLDGHIYDRGGKQVDLYACDLLHVARADTEIDTYAYGSPISNLPRGFRSSGDIPGKYVLAADIYAPFVGTNKKRYYYPGVEDFKNAQIFDVQPASQFPNLRFAIPFTVREVTGEFVWDNGEKVEGRAQGWLDRHREENRQTNPSFDWDFRDVGYFQLQAYEGFEYWVRASIAVQVMTKEGKRSDTFEAEPQKINVGDGDITLRFVVKKPANLVVPQ